MAQGSQRGQGSHLGKRRCPPAGLDLGVISTDCKRDTQPSLESAHVQGRQQLEPSGGNVELETIFNGGPDPLLGKTRPLDGSGAPQMCPCGFLSSEKRGLWPFLIPGLPS